MRHIAEQYADLKEWAEAQEDSSLDDLLSIAIPIERWVGGDRYHLHIYSISPQFLTQLSGFVMFRSITLCRLK